MTEVEKNRANEHDDKKLVPNEFIIYNMATSTCSIMNKTDVQLEELNRKCSNYERELLRLNKKINQLQKKLDG